MGEYIESFTDEQKRVLLSLIAIEKVTTLKMHRVFKDLNGIEKILEFNCKVRVLDNFSTGKKENIENFLQNSNY